MAARYYQRLREGFAEQERKLSTALVVVGVLTGACAGVAVQWEPARWVLVALGATSALLSALHRQRSFNVEAAEAGRYSHYFDDRAADWENLFSRIEHDPESVSFADVELHVAKDERLPLARFKEDAALEKQAYEEVYRVLG